MSGRRLKTSDGPGADSRMRLLLAIPSYRGGGAERVITTLASRFPVDRYDVHLVVVQNEGPLREGLPDTVTHHDLGCQRVSQSALPLLRLIRSLRPDVVLTAASHLNMLTGMLQPLFPSHTRLIVRETGVLKTSLAAWRLGRVMRPVLGAAYRRAAAVIGQSEFAIQEIHQTLGVPLDRLVRIANPVEVGRHTPDLRHQTTSPFEGVGPHLLCVGRFGPEKGFDRAIDGLPALRRSHPQAQLWILGEGTEQASLEQRARELGLDQAVHFPGFQSDVSRWMAHADLFLLSSRTESLPNVLLEAIACGAPVLALEQVGGTREILAQLGLSDRWATELDSWQSRWFDRPAPEIREQLVKRFHWQSIVQEYEQLFASVTDCATAIPPARRAA